MVCEMHIKPYKTRRSIKTSVLSMSVRCSSQKTQKDEKHFLFSKKRKKKKLFYFKKNYRKRKKRFYT